MPKISLNIEILKNQYLWEILMGTNKKQKKKKKYPYYATPWFFFGILILGWMTPVTKHWKYLFYGESTTANRILVRQDNGEIVARYIFESEHYTYLSEFSRLMTGPLPKKKTIYFMADNPKENLVFFWDLAYEGANLFFPLALQIGMIAFFVSVRFKD